MFEQAGGDALWHVCLEHNNRMNWKKKDEASLEIDMAIEKEMAEKNRGNEGSN